MIGKINSQNNLIVFNFYSFWLTRKGPECFSVFNQPRRTNNNIESFHSSLKQTFQVTHPNLWRMLGEIFLLIFQISKFWGEAENK